MATFVVNGSNTTVNFDYTATTTKVMNTITDAGHELYQRLGKTDAEFDALTNQQKLNVVDAYLKAHILQLAKGFHIEEAKEAATATASGETETRYL